MRTRNPNRVSLLLALATVSLSLIWLVASKYVGPPLVENIYHGDSLPIFNRMISGQASHPLEEYLADWAGFKWRFLSDFCLVGILIVLALRPEFHRSLWERGAATARKPCRCHLPRLVCSWSWPFQPVLFVFFSRASDQSIRVRFFFDRYLFDPNDLIVYFNSSSWAVGKGKLYIDVLIGVSRSGQPSVRLCSLAFLKTSYPRFEL